jgi:hypothetical protein
MGKDSFTTGTLAIFLLSLIFMLKYQFLNRKINIDFGGYSIVLLSIGLLSTLSVDSSNFLPSFRLYVYFLSSIFLFLVVINYIKTLDYEGQIKVIDQFLLSILLLLSFEVIWGIIIFQFPHVGKLLNIFTTGNIDEITTGVTFVLDHRPVIRLRGIILGGEELGEALAITWPFLLYFLVIKKKMFCYIIITIYLIGLIMSNTRSAIVLAVFSTFVFLFVCFKINEGKYALKSILYLLFPFTIIYFFFPTIIDNVILRMMASIYNFSKTGLSLETLNRARFEDVFYFVSDNLNLFGNGFLIIYKDQRYNFHNLYFTVIYKFGIIGFLVFFSIFTKIMIQLLKSFNLNTLSKKHYTLLWASLLSLSVLLIDSFKFEFDRGASYQPLVWFILGIHYSGIMAVKKASLNPFEKKMKSILIISARQFGLQNNFLEFCKLYPDTYRITYISNDLGYKKVSVDGIRTIYIRRKKGKILNRLIFLYNSLKYINNIRPAILLISYFPLSFLLGVFGKIKNIVTIIDIRSGSIRKKWRLNNYLLRVECLFFTNITIISKSLSNFLKISKSNNYVYSVGFNKKLLTITEKTFREYNLLYVGSLLSRQLFLTIYAFDRFCNDHPELKLKYKIVGYGGLEDEEMIIQAIQNSRNSDKIIFEGYKTDDELFFDFQEFNIGVSFIPVNEYFQFQPPIKTYEYLAAGMPVIATNTYENLKILNKYNSIIIPATEKGFYDGLKKIIEKASIFNSYKIQEPIRHFSWDVVNSKYEEFLRKKLSN